MKKTLSILLAFVMIVSVFSVAAVTTTAAVKDDVAVTGVLAAPKLNIENVNGGQKLTYALQKGAAKYRIFLKVSGKWQKLVDTNKSYTYTKVKSFEKYTYTIRALDKNGKYISDYNKNGFSKFYVAPPKIYDLKRTLNYITIRIIPTHPAYGYRVFVKNSTGWKKVNDILLSDIKEDSYPVFKTYYMNPKAGQKYTFTVRAFDDQGKYCSGYDATGNTIDFFNESTAPTLTQIENLSNGVRVKWAKQSGVAKYRVFVDKGSGWTKLIDTTSLYMIDKTVKDGNYRVYTVRGINSKGNYCTAYDTDGLPTIWHKPAKKTIADEDVVWNSLKKYAAASGFSTGDATQHYYSNLIILPDDYPSNLFVNTGDMTHILIKYAKGKIKAEADYLKAAGTLSDILSFSCGRPMHGGDYEHPINLYFVNKNKYYDPEW